MHSTRNDTKNRPAANTNIPDRTHESGAALTAVPLLFACRRASLARRIHNSLTNDIRRGHNSHRQGDLYRSSSGCHRRVTAVTFIRPPLPYIPYIDRKVLTHIREVTPP